MVPEKYVRFDVAETQLEEWLDYLKNGRIKDGTSTPGLAEAAVKLQYMMMSREEQQQYFRYMDLVKFERNALETSRLEGLNEGVEIGRAEGETRKILLNDENE